MGYVSANNRRAADWSGDAADWSGAEWLPELLETISEFGSASLELVAWELSLPENALWPAWRQAIGEHLIEPAGVCDQTDEQPYRLAPGVVIRTQP